jgi:hypothetical protein
LVRAVRVQIGTFGASAHHAPASLAGWRRQLVGMAPTLLRLANEVRRALRLPEPLTGQLPQLASRRTP